MPLKPINRETLKNYTRGRNATPRSKDELLKNHYPQKARLESGWIQCMINKLANQACDLIECLKNKRLSETDVATKDGIIHSHQTRQIARSICLEIREKAATKKKGSLIGKLTNVVLILLGNGF